MRRFISLFLTFFLIISNSSVSLAAPTATRPESSEIVRSLTVAPYVAKAGGEITVSADLNLPHQPQVLTMTFTEVGPNPVKVDVALRRAEDGTYSGTYSFPEVIDRSLGMIPTQLSYTRIEPYGEREYRYPVVTSQGGFFVMRQTVKLLAWEMPSTAFVGDTVAISLTLEAPLPFQAPVRAVLETTNLVTPVTAQSEIITSDTATFATTVTLPATPARYELKGLRVGSDLVPLHHGHQVAVVSSGQEVPAPELTNLSLSWSTDLKEHLSATFINPDSVINARIKVAGPYHYEGWIDLARQPSGCFAISTEAPTLPYTGDYHLTGIQVTSRRGRAETLTMDQIVKWGYLSFFHMALPSTTSVLPTQPDGGIVTEVRMETVKSSQYMISIKTEGPASNALSVTIAGNRSTFTAVCRQDDETGIYQGDLVLPDWAKGGLYSITRIADDNGHSVSFTGAPSVLHVASNPDTIAPTVKAIQSSVTGLSGEARVTVHEGQSGVKAVLLTYIHPATGLSKRLAAVENDAGLWAAKADFSAQERGYWAMVSVQLTDYAGNIRYIGSGAYDERFFPEAGWLIDTSAMDRTPPELREPQVTLVDQTKRFSVELHEDRSHVEMSSVVVTMDGNRVPCLWDPVTSILSLVPVRDSGLAILLEIQAEDSSVNKLTKQIIF